MQGGEGKVRELEPGPAPPPYLPRITELKTALDKAFGISLNLCTSNGEMKAQSSSGTRAQALYFPAWILVLPHHPGTS